MRGIHDGNMSGYPIVHMHIFDINKEEVSHTKEGGKPSWRMKVQQSKINNLGGLNCPGGGGVCAK